MALTVTTKSTRLLLALVSTALLLWIQTLRRLSQHLDPASTSTFDTRTSPWRNLSSKRIAPCAQQLSDASDLSKKNDGDDGRWRRGSQHPGPLQESDLPQILAIYFPQFHPDPLNDRLWQVNFTDWVSLQAAPKHNRLGVRIPRPADGVYYDLRETAVRQRQGQLARQYGVDGFVMHHYWFYDPSHPGPNLHAPLERMLHDQQPQIKFLFNWCASSWTSLWTGNAAGQTKAGTQNNPVVLQEQYWNATTDDIRKHYEWLRQFWILPNYIRVQNQPVLMIYQYFPQMKRILQQLRTWANQDDQVGNGLVIWMSRSATHPDLYDISALDENTQRIWKRRSQQAELLPTPASRHDGYVWNATVAYPYPNPWVSGPLQIPAWCWDDQVMRDDPTLGALREIPGVVTSFDNTPRRQADKALLWNVEKDPQKVIQRFADSLYAAVYYETCCRPTQLAASTDNTKFVMINAWNEWAEAMALEPSDVYGTGFLQAIRDTKDKVLQQGCGQQIPGLQES